MMTALTLPRLNDLFTPRPTVFGVVTFAATKAKATSALQVLPAGSRRLRDLFTLAETGDVTAAAGYLNDHPATINDTHPLTGGTALHAAALHCRGEMAALLLARGADANARDLPAGGITPLHLALQNGDALMVRLLLAHGADPDAATDLGLTPRCLATLHHRQHLLPTAPVAAA